MRLLKDGGYIEAAIAVSHTGDGLINDGFIKHLTFKGHELLNTIRNENIWSQIKILAKNKSLELIPEVVVNLGKKLMSDIVNT